jgi:hypothetical protein
LQFVVSAENVRIKAFKEANLAKLSAEELVSQKEQLFAHKEQLHTLKQRVIGYIFHEGLDKITFDSVNFCSFIFFLGGGRGKGAWAVRNYVSPFSSVGKLELCVAKN